MSRSDVGRVGVWGRSGSGKSSYIKKRTKGARRVIYFDPLGEYTHRLTARIEHRARDDLDRVRQAIRDRWADFRLSYIPPAAREVAALDGLSRLLLRVQDGYRQGAPGARPLTLVVEEMNLAFPVAGGAERCPGFAEVCSRGRHYGIEVIGASQRIAEVATRFRGNCTETVVFAQQGKRDLAAAAHELGEGDTGAVAGLASLQYIHRGPGGTARHKVKFPI